MWWTEYTWPWLSEWASSPGFAGAVALVAAAVTLTVTTRKNRHETWWEQTEWALGKYVDEEASAAEHAIGADAVRVLVKSPLATKQEMAFLSAVMTATVLERGRSPSGDSNEFPPVAKESEAVDNEATTEEGP